MTFQVKSNMQPIVTRTETELRPDPSRVVAKPFLPGESAFAGGPSRLELIGRRVMSLDRDQAALLLEATRKRFVGRHADLESVWEEHLQRAQGMLPWITSVTGTRRALLGAFFTQEYALEAAAICNPSMVPDPDDSSRFVMTLRAIGEGHISSVEFRTGKVEKEPILDPPSEFLTTGTRHPPTYDKKEFATRLAELHADKEVTRTILDYLNDFFSNEDLGEAIDRMHRTGVSEAMAFETARLANWVASSNYEISFPPGDLCSRVLLPAGPTDSRGIEDVRMVRFEHEDGSVEYLGTYTAFDGFTVLPQLIETKDFQTFRMSTMTGSCARNKGMALFPRKINGLYTALGRHDNENLHVMWSDRVRAWNIAEVIYRPEAGWEAIQTGNCGPPIETEAGWLVLTHGVGPMRRYAMGAILLDLAHPQKVIARLTEPLLEPDEDERNGYVPNVVYSCGGMVNNGNLILPYGFADQGVRIALIDLEGLIGAMRPT